jgi:hypothetical protein
VILRVLNLIVIGALVLAAAYVYRIKYEATAQAERLDKLRDELRHERDKIAALRAEWGALDDPARIEALTKRFLKLKPVESTQFDNFAHLPDQPPDYMRPGSKDPIGGMIDHLGGPADVTSSITAPLEPSAPAGDASPTASGSPDETPGPTAAAAPPEAGAHSP